MDWTRGPTIGRGATATVSLATASTSGEVFAVKSTEISRAKMLQRERSLLSRLSCDRIVKYLGSDITCEGKGEGGTTSYNVFMEYVSGGALSDEIRRRGGRLDEARIRLYTRQILEGLEYLHGNGVVHCDIKSENVLIRDDGAVIADLGCAKSVISGGGGSVFYGTPVFMAPEVARGEEQDFPVDVWALGCTVIEMATGGCSPWPEVNDAVSAVYRIGFSGDVPEFPVWLSENGRDFLDKCLRRDPRERWTAKELLEHPFLEDGTETNSKQVREYPMKSPTSVLDDQGFWDFQEAPAAPSVLPHIASSSDSPAERIRRLINQGATSSGSNLPGWTWDEDWVTVRSNYIEERPGFSQEEPENLLLNDNFFLENSPENINSSSSSSISFSISKAHESVNDSLVFKDLIFRLIIKMLHLLQTVHFLLHLLAGSSIFPSWGLRIFLGKYRNVDLFRYQVIQEVNLKLLLYSVKIRDCACTGQYCWAACTFGWWVDLNVCVEFDSLICFPRDFKELIHASTKLSLIDKSYGYKWNHRKEKCQRHDFLFSCKNLRR